MSRVRARSRRAMRLNGLRKGLYQVRKRGTARQGGRDALLKASYRPVPGTVIFAGYGSTFDDPSPFRFRELSRTTDGFFVKLSYLFRA